MPESGSICRRNLAHEIYSEPSTSDSDVKTVKQLGVFAKEDITPGEEILKEKSLLTAVSRLHDSYCDACSVYVEVPHKR